jgi:hypothetical protein
MCLPNIDRILDESSHIISAAYGTESILTRKSTSVLCCDVQMCCNTLVKDNFYSYVRYEYRVGKGERIHKDCRSERWILLRDQHKTLGAEPLVHIRYEQYKWIPDVETCPEIDLCLSESLITKWHISGLSGRANRSYSASSIHCKIRELYCTMNKNKCERSVHICHLI